MSTVIEPNRHDRFLLRQRFKLVIDQYEFFLTHSRQPWKLGDTYEIDLAGDHQRTLDRRLVLPIAVGMDALQAR